VADFDRSEPLLRTSLELAGALGDQQMVALAHALIGQDFLLQGRLREAREFNELAVNGARQFGPRYYLPIFLFNAGWTALRQERLEDAKVLLDESISLSRTLGDDFSLSIALPLRATVAVLSQTAGAWDYLLEAERVADDLPFKGLGMARIGIGRLALREGDDDRAANYFRNALDIAVRAGRPVQICESLEGLAFVAATRQDLRTATQLLGAVAAARKSMYRGRPPDYRHRLQAALAQWRHAMGDDDFRQFWNTGLALSLDQAVAFAQNLP
jgi:tetratricopeptide (TPR) repeat protein